MSLTREYVQRPPAFSAVLVTPENAVKVAEWCGGVVEHIGQTDFVAVTYWRRNPFKRKKLDKFSVSQGEFLVRRPDGDFIDMPPSYFHENFKESPDA